MIKQVNPCCDTLECTFLGVIILLKNRDSVQKLNALFTNSLLTSAPFVLYSGLGFAAHFSKKFLYFRFNRWLFSELRKAVSLRPKPRSSGLPVHKRKTQNQLFGRALSLDLPVHSLLDHIRIDSVDPSHSLNVVFDNVDKPIFEC